MYAKNAGKQFVSPMHGFSPAQRLFHRVAAFSLVLTLVHSMNFANAYDGTGNYLETSNLEINPDEIAFVEDSGYLIKSTPSTTETPRYLNRDDTIKHEVQPSETLSQIAYIYDLDVNTIYWANKDVISNVNALRVGQILDVPVADGYLVTVSSGDTVDALIKKYKGDKDKTIALEWNHIEDGELTTTEKILIVDGQPYYPPVASSSSSSYTSSSSGGYVATAPTNVTPSPGGSGWFKPTSGILTQGYHAGHYAYDIAGPMGTAIFAAADGVVSKSSVGTWGGGYGNHVIIDHDNGCKTLYAHNSEVYVSVGEYVSGGQVIAAMGNTGRVYGRTGIHLHVELQCNGVKQNPGVLFGW